MTLIRQERSREGIALTIGVLLSIGLGILFYFFTDNTIANATFAALLGTMIALQIENMIREQKVTERITEQQRLISEAAAVEWLPGKLEELLRAVRSIEANYRGTIAMSLVRNIFDECNDQMKNLQRGHFDTAFDDNRLLYELTENIRRRTIRAVSIEDVDLDWWQSAAGETYWELNKKAIERSVQIERIFVYRSWTDDHERIASKQHAAKVTVRLVDQARLRAPLLNDMIIWGDECGFHSSLNAMGGKPITNNYTFAEPELKKMIEKYNEIKSCSRIWAPPKGGNT